MKRFLFSLIFAVVVGCNCQPADCQTTELNAELDVARAAAVSHDIDGQVMEAETSFHRAVIQAAMAKVKRGEMKRLDLIRLRVAMLSPAFREAAEDLAVIQMAASGSDNIPTDDDGKIARAQIDWDAIIAFIEKLIPLLIKLISIFNGLGDVSFDLFHGSGLTYANIYVNGHYFGTVV